MAGEIRPALLQLSEPRLPDSSGGLKGE